MDRKPCCPECRSESLEFKEGKRPFSLSWALLGLWFLGPIGLLLGLIGQSRVRIGKWFCQNCGEKLRDPDSRIDAIRNNNRGFNMYLTLICILSIIGIFIVYSIAFTILILMAFSLIGQEKLPLLILIMLGIFFVFVIIELVLFEFIRFVVNKIFDKFEEKARRDRAKMELEPIDEDDEVEEIEVPVKEPVEVEEVVEETTEETTEECTEVEAPKETNE